jgi:hypothetical protein
MICILIVLQIILSCYLLIQNLHNLVFVGRNPFRFLFKQMGYKGTNLKMTKVRNERFLRFATYFPVKGSVIKYAKIM